MFGYPMLISIDFYDFTVFSVFSLVLVLIEKIHVNQTLKTVFNHICPKIMCAQEVAQEVLVPQEHVSRHKKLKCGVLKCKKKKI